MSNNSVLQGGEKRKKRLGFSHDTNLQGKSKFAFIKAKAKLESSHFDSALKDGVI